MFSIPASAPKGTVQLGTHEIWLLDMGRTEILILWLLSLGAIFGPYAILELRMRRARLKLPKRADPEIGSVGPAPSVGSVRLVWSNPNKKATLNRQASP